MTRDRTPFLNEEYCFADDTFKRYPGYVTLWAFIYVKILRKMLKLCIMDIESESSENWLIFWRLFNQLLTDYLEVPTIFSPIRWFLDGNVNQWKSVSVSFVDFYIFIMTTILLKITLLITLLLKCKLVMLLLPTVI